MKEIVIIKKYRNYIIGEKYNLDPIKADYLIENGYAKLTISNYFKTPISKIKNIKTRAFGKTPN